MRAKSNFSFYILILVILSFITVLQYELWFSNTGIIQYHASEKSVQEKSAYVDHKKQENLKLYSEVVSLRKNSSVLEGLARQNMNFVKKGEIFYSVN